MPRKTTDIHMPHIEVQWAYAEKISATEKNDTALRFVLTAAQEDHTFTVTFPRLGGMRIRSNDGFFPCDDVLPITYAADGTITAGNMKLLFTEDAARLFVLTVLDAAGEPLFTIDSRFVAFGYANGVCKKILYRLPLTAGELLYGMGERFNNLDQVGSVAYLWNEDTGFCQDERDAYKNIPLLHSTKGYAAFFNTMYGGFADFGVTESDITRIDFNGPICDMFFFNGTPAENLDSYTQLTGRPMLLPKWAYQYWMGSSWTSWRAGGDELCTEKFRKILEGYKEIGISHLAACYAEGLFNYPESFEIAKESGIRMLSWNHPSLRFNHYDHMGSQEETMMELLGDTDPAKLPILYKAGTDYEPLKGTLIDFTHPNAMLFLKRYYRNLFARGLKGAMIDFGEIAGAEGIYYNGKDGNAMHNEFSYWYAKTMHDLFRENCGDDYVLFQRSGCAGAQRFTAHFGGDQVATYRGLREAFVAALNVGACGYSNWGSDIGGLGGNYPTNELYIRWLQFGTFSPLMRAHSQSREKMREPWEYGDTAVEVFKTLYWWRENMLPYTYSTAVYASLTGTPMMRAMPFAYPQDTVLTHVEDEYMFGDELLVAPVLTDHTNHRLVSFPDGRWVNLWNGKSYVGGRKLDIFAPLTDIPVYLRAGTVVPLTLPTDTLAICENMEGKACTTALLTTPADTKREIVHYESATAPYRFTTAATEDAALVLENTDGLTVGGVIVCGIQAKAVVCDGKEIAFTTDTNCTRIALQSGFKTLTVR